jgi:hypothetical protein
MCPILAVSGTVTSNNTGTGKGDSGEVPHVKNKKTQLAMPHVTHGHVCACCRLCISVTFDSHASLLPCFNTLTPILHPTKPNLQMHSP